MVTCNSGHATMSAANCFGVQVLGSSLMFKKYLNYILNTDCLQYIEKCNNYSWWVWKYKVIMGY